MQSLISYLLALQQLIQEESVKNRTVTSQKCCCINLRPWEYKRETDRMSWEFRRSSQRSFRLFTAEPRSGVVGL